MLRANPACWAGAVFGGVHVVFCSNRVDFSQVCRLHTQCACTCGGLTLRGLGWFSRGRHGAPWHAHVSAHGVEGFQKMSCISRGRRRTLDTSIVWQVQHFRRVLLRVFRLALSGLRQVVTTCKWRGSSRTSRECHFPWQGQYNIWCRSVVGGMSFCVAGAIFRTLYAWHFTFNTLLHFTLYTPQSTTLYYTLLHTITHYYILLRSTTLYYTLLPSTTPYYTPLHSTTHR